jgi:Ser/Thr protein kinase RdoA (MazF antagonist)
VHRDFRPGNVIIHDGKIQGIIDWASGRASFAEEDFCPLEHGEWPTSPVTKASFLAGYASIRPVPDYSQIMPLLRLSRSFATMGFLIKKGTWKTIHARVYQSNRQSLDRFLQSY